MWQRGEKHAGVMLQVQHPSGDVILVMDDLKSMNTSVQTPLWGAQDIAPFTHGAFTPDGQRLCLAGKLGVAISGNKECKVLPFSAPRPLLALWRRPAVTVLSVDDFGMVAGYDQGSIVKIDWCSLGIQHAQLGGGAVRSVCLDQERVHMLFANGTWHCGERAIGKGADMMDAIPI